MKRRGWRVIHYHCTRQGFYAKKHSAYQSKSQIGAATEEHPVLANWGGLGFKQWKHMESETVLKWRQLVQWKERVERVIEDRREFIRWVEVIWHVSTKVDLLMANGCVIPFMFGGASAHTKRLQRVKQIIVGISFTALGRANVHCSERPPQQENVQERESER